jgi:hypothetical protein
MVETGGVCDRCDPSVEAGDCALTYAADFTTSCQSAGDLYQIGFDTICKVCKDTFFFNLGTKTCDPCNAYQSRSCEQCSMTSESHIDQFDNEICVEQI